MRRRAVIVLTVEFALLAIIAGSTLALGKNSQDFLLAERQASIEPLQVGLPVILTGQGHETGVLLGDWSRTAPWAAIAERRTAVLALKLPPGQASILNFDGWLLARKPAVRQIDVSLDGRAIGSMIAANTSDKVSCSWSIPLPPVNQPLSLLRFTVVAPALPAGAEQTSYQNRLMFGLASMTLATAPVAARCGTGASLHVTDNGPAGLAG